MSRGMLDYSDGQLFVQELPDLSELQGLVLTLSPDFISIPFSPENPVPAASVCLQDTLHTLAEAKYALSEVFAHQIWYLQKKDPPNRMAAAFFGRFYADDAALRLYSAGEHLANGIIMMLEIGDEELKPYKLKGKRISQQLVVGSYLPEKKANHPITKAVIRLADSNEWQATLSYRNRWVHEQPPTVKGLGIVYRRGQRWKPLPTGKGYTLGIGGGDVPEYAIEDLVGFIKPAIFKFTDTFTSVVNSYVEILEDRRKRKNQP